MVAAVVLSTYFESASGAVLFSTTPRSSPMQPPIFLSSSPVSAETAAAAAAVVITAHGEVTTVADDGEMAFLFRRRDPSAPDSPMIVHEADQICKALKDLKLDVIALRGGSSSALVDYLEQADFPVGWRLRLVGELFPSSLG